MLKLELADNTRARSLHCNRINEYRETEHGGKIRAQYQKYAYFGAMLKHRKAR